MSDEVARRSLLPLQTFPREKAIAGADAGIEDLDVAAIIRARDVAHCLPVYLPALAWERSVDVWDPAWPDAVKRAVIDAAPEVHRHKGTVYAVRTALAALGVDTTVSEWWQESPRGTPYTFRVTALVRGRLYDGPLLDARLIRVVFASVLHVKPESRAFDLDIVALTGNTLTMAPAALARTKYREAAVPAPPPPLFRRALGLAPVALARTKFGEAAVPAPPSPALAHDLGLAATVLTRARVAIAATATLPSP